MKLTPWLVLLCLSLVSCSGSKSAKTVDETTPQIELSDADEFIENPFDEPLPEVAVDSGLESVETDEAITINSEFTPDQNVELGTTRQYQVKENETLMLIAFKLYGDYGKWKSIANQNQDVLKGSTALKTGMTLNYEAPAEEFIWSPSGSPYLIRTGDTLGTISQSVYQTVKKWKQLWENNKPLIKDPNKIYAGFTIYYVDGREVASEF